MMSKNATGTAIVGVAGAVLTGRSTVGTAGGAGVGGVIGKAPVRYRFLGRSVLANVGARPAGKPGGLGTWTFFGFFASLLPCFPLLIVVSFGCR